MFATEPCTDSPLFELPQVVVTPHLGASTEEAQDRAGTDVAESVRLALAGEFVPDAVNVGGGVVSEEVAPWLDLARKLGVLAAALSDGLPASLSVQVRGELAAEDVEVLKLSALRGLFSAVIEDPVPSSTRRRWPPNAALPPRSARLRRAPTTAASWTCGRSLTTAPPSTSPAHCPARNWWRRSFRSTAATSTCAPEGTNLVINYADQPGALGKIGTLLGAAGVNIQAAQLSEDAEGDSATILLRLDQDVPATCGRDRATRWAQQAGSGRSVVNLDDAQEERPMKLAVIGGDGIGPEVVGRGAQNP